MTEPPAAPTEPKAAPEAKPPADPAADLQAQLRLSQSALDAERKNRVKFESEVAKLKQAHQSESEKAIEAARAEGRAEAVKGAGVRLAAAEFRARAAGKIADPSALIEAMDLAKFVADDGEPNTKLIDTVIDKLAAALANGKGPAAPVVPAGARTDPGESDWLRAAMSGGGG